MMSDACECGMGMELPVNGLRLSVDPSRLGLVDESRVRELIQEALVASPGGAIRPNLKIGEETLWPATLNGKQVYATLVDCGTMPNSGTKEVEHGISDVEWIKVEWNFSYITSGERFLGIVYPGPSHGYAFYGDVSKSHIRLRALSDWRASQGVVCLVYTKESDPVIA